MSVEGHEVRPRLVQHEPDAMRIDDDHFLTCPEQLGALRGGAELDVLGGERVAVVELQAWRSLNSYVRDRGSPSTIPRDSASDIAGHRLHERVVHGVEDQNGVSTPMTSADRTTRRERHVERPAHLASAWPGPTRAGRAGQRAASSNRTRPRATLRVRLMAPPVRK